MSLLERPAEPVIGDMGVDLGGGQRGVPEHLLHAPQVGATLQKVRGHGVSQTVRPEVRRPFDQPQCAVDDAPHHPLVDPLSPFTEEDRVGRLGGREFVTPPVKPAIHRPQSRHPDRDRALLVALAEDPHHASLTVDVSGVEGTQLRNPDPGRIEQLQDGDIAQPDGTADLVGSSQCLGQHPLSIDSLERRWQPAHCLRRSEQGRRVARAGPRSLRPVEEHPGRRRTALQRRAGLTPGLLVGQPAAHIPEIDLVERKPTQSLQMHQQAADIASVGPDRVLGKVSLQLQVPHIVGNQAEIPLDQGLGLGSRRLLSRRVSFGFVGHTHTMRDVGARRKAPRRAGCGRDSQVGMNSSGRELSIHDVVVGGYTAESGGTAPGISSYRVFADTEGALQAVEGQTVQLVSPSYLVRHPDKPLLFAVSEGSPGRVTSVQLGTNQAGGPVAFTVLGSVAAGGDEGCHLAISPGGNQLVVANYGSGSISSYAIRDDGRLSECLDVLRFAGSGPDPDRQAAPHAHQVVWDADEILVADLGSDRIHRVLLNADGSFETAAEPIVLPAGSGPRHLVLLDQHLLVACELSAEVWLAKRTDHGWQHLQSLAASSTTAPVDLFPSAIVADGTRVFVANRGSGTVAAFDLDPVFDRLTQVAEFPCGGSWPRDLTLVGSQLWVANQTDDLITVLTTSGLPAVEIVAQIGSPTPACIILLEAQPAGIT
jgi:6-phosphogluconolactonase